MRGSVLAITIAMLSPSGLAFAASDPLDKYAITPQEHAACDSDAQRLCVSFYPDEENMLKCMRDSRPQLTPVCLASLNAGLKRRHMRY